jgi:hypothetical protein
MVIQLNKNQVNMKNLEPSLFNTISHEINVTKDYLNMLKQIKHNLKRGKSSFYVKVLLSSTIYNVAGKFNIEKEEPCGIDIIMGYNVLKYKLTVNE